MGSNSYFGMRLPAFYSLGRTHFAKRKIKPIQFQKDGRRLAIRRWLSHCMYSSPRGMLNPFLPTVPTFAVRETDASRHNGGTSGAPLKPLKDDSALRALSHEWA